MAWLKHNVEPGQMVANDQTVDAGIWAPYKADVPILLRRSSSGADILDRQPILANVGDLNGAPGASGTKGDVVRRVHPAGSGRLSAGTAAFTLTFVLAEPGDPLTDPTAAWPAQRRAVEMGRLVLERVLEDQQGGCEERIFDPTVVTDGIECSADPILHARSLAYSVSYARRRGIGDSDRLFAHPEEP